MSSSELITHHSSLITPPAPPAPPPRADVTVRDATMADVPFVDALQKLHGEQVGFMAKSWIEGKIAKGEVIVAEDSSGQPVGYCMGVDRYFKRDDVGIIHQMNVLPVRQRGFVGATLLRAMFDRAAYGCKLFCCWCAQDIEANRFWEAMGFVPLAYRAGSQNKGPRTKDKGQRPRVHIFWQKRIRQGDVTTDWWFPTQTTGGALKEDRIVLPIPPGLRWSDEMPVIVLPKEEAAAEPKRIDGPAPRKPRAKKSDLPAPTTASRRLSFAPATPPTPVKPEPKPREKRPRRKNDPRLVAKVREVKDRWLEHINSGAYVEKQTVSPINTGKFCRLVCYLCFPRL